LINRAISRALRESVATASGAKASTVAIAAIEPSTDPSFHPAPQEHLTLV
jgi:hypothetical protein